MRDDCEHCGFISDHSGVSSQLVQLNKDEAKCKLLLSWSTTQLSLALHTISISHAVRFSILSSGCYGRFQRRCRSAVDYRPPSQRSKLWRLGPVWVLVMDQLMFCYMLSPSSFLCKCRERERERESISSCFDAVSMYPCKIYWIGVLGVGVQINGQTNPTLSFYKSFFESTEPPSYWKRPLFFCARKTWRTNRCLQEISGQEQKVRISLKDLLYWTTNNEKRYIIPQNPFLLIA
jgi:hypothetical protein